MKRLQMGDKSNKSSSTRSVVRTFTGDGGLLERALLEEALFQQHAGTLVQKVAVLDLPHNERARVRGREKRI